MEDLFRTLFNRLVRAYRDNPLTTAAGREYLYSDHAKRFEALVPEDTSEHTPAVTVTDAESLIAWCTGLARPHAAEAISGQVVISRRGETSALTPVWTAKHIARERAAKAFYMGYMPAGKFEVTLGYVDFLSWVELLGERIEGAERLELALKTVSAIDSESIKVSSDGAVIRLSGESEAGPRLNAPLQKRIKTLIPFGDPTCVTSVEFGLQCSVGADKAVRFTLRHLESDGAFDAYAEWMRGRLAVLPSSWLVLVGP